MIGGLGAQPFAVTLDERVAHPGIAPSGLFVGPIVPGAKDDIAVVSARRAECADGSCGDGSEIRVIAGNELALSLRRKEVLTASNAVGLRGWKRDPTQRFADLVTAGQGRSRVGRTCSLVSSCLDYLSPECELHSEACGCPPRERCECPAGRDCTANDEGLCVADDKELEVLINTHDSNGSGLTPSAESCRQPELSCEKAGQNTRGSCRCADNPANHCETTDSCGCPIPNRSLIGAHGATARPFGLAAPTGDVIVAATSAGLDFLIAQDSTDRYALRWKVSTLNAPIHGVEILEQDEDTVDLAWFSRADGPEPACLDNRPSDACPILPTGASGATPGCLGLIAASTFDSLLPPLDPVPGGERVLGAASLCLQYALDFRPEGMCVGRLNHDPYPDVVLSSGSGIWVFLGSLAGGFVLPQTSYPIESGPVTCADLDGDGLTEVISVVKRSAAQQAIVVLRP